MKRFHILILAGILLSGLLNTVSLPGQVITNPEAEYFRIRSAAFEGKYEYAASEARRLVNSNPEYGDARILLGRILAWQEKYNEAIVVIDSLLTTDPGNEDALSARADIYKWMKAAEKENKSETTVMAGYSFDLFEEPYSRFWQLYRAGAGHKFNWGTTSGYINAGHVQIGDPDPAKSTELQLEADAYPVISKLNYAYLDYAFSPGKYFPRHRAAFEIWQVLPAKWSISAGLTYYYFDRSIYIASSSVEKYFGKYWLSLKGYLYFKDEGPTTSGYLNARRYFSDTDYLQVTLGTGTAPDEPFDVQTDIMRLSANSIRMVYNRKIKNAFTIRAGAGYSLEEFAESQWRNRFEANLGVTYSLGSKR